VSRNNQAESSTGRTHNKAAEALGLTIPGALLATADEVIQ
jgi:hypothetical protein